VCVVCVGVLWFVTAECEVANSSSAAKASFARHPLSPSLPSHHPTPLPSYTLKDPTDPPHKHALVFSCSLA